MRARVLLTLSSSIAAVALAFGVPRLSAAAQTVNCTTSGAVTTCKIDQPIVTQAVTTYPQIVFKPNDLVTVSAGGCVQTGGLGKTWKLYVDPSGSNSDRLYHGLIQIPGVESDLVRIAGAMIHPLSVPSTIDPKGVALRLGYEDDNYSDNGYYSHDDGTDDQCKNVGDAFVVITIDRGAGNTNASVAAPFDLVFTQTDPNDFPFDGEWGWQKETGQLPDASKICLDLANGFNNPSCTTQTPSVDSPGGWNGFWCGTSANTSIDGHVNWMPGTWEGPIAWDGHSQPGSDDDYNINLTPPGGAGLTANNAGTIHTEFDSDETIDHFTTAWWQGFHKAVDTDDTNTALCLEGGGQPSAFCANEKNASTLIDGHDAIVVGLFGLDCEHSCSAELHPVYALAIHVKDDVADDTWAIFARNWGDEGYCSQDSHLLDTRSIAFLIPRALATGVKVTSADFLTNGAASGPAVSLAAGGAIVQFGLPDPSASTSLDGELHLSWTVRQPLPITGNAGAHELAARAGTLPGTTTIPPIGKETEENSEAKLAALVRGLPRAKQAAIVSALQDSVAETPRALASLKTTPSRLVLRPTVSAVFDTTKAQRDAKRAKALCAAFGGNIPGSPTACKLAPP
jgi:hypothetical protein